MPHKLFAVSRFVPRSHAVGLIAVAVVAGVSAAHAEENRPLDTQDTLSLVVENDKFTGRDRHYTNGLRLSWLSGEDVPGWVHGLGDVVPFFAENGRRRYGVAIGHSIFTPENTETSAPILDDRPYAGWLYGAFSLTSDTGSTLDTLELELGVVGPAAGGEWVQNTWHDLIGVDEAQGWDNQLHNEPGVVLFYERKWRALFETNPGGLGFDAHPNVGFALGNVYTYAKTGLTLRFGEDLPADYGPPRVQPALPGSAFFTPRRGFGWYLFAGVEGRAVAHDIFLDGNTFKDSQSVDKEPFVADLQAGIAVTFDAVRIAYTQVYRTREFEGQDRPDTFGAISVSYRW